MFRKEIQFLFTVLSVDDKIYKSGDGVQELCWRQPVNYWSVRYTNIERSNAHSAHEINKSLHETRKLVVFKAQLTLRPKTSIHSPPKHSRPNRGTRAETPQHNSHLGRPVRQNGLTCNL